MTTITDHGWPWSGKHGLTMVNHGQFHIQKSNDMVWIMVKYLMCRYSNQHTSGRWTWLNHGQPWLTMVWQCFDHGWTMVDHGQVISGNHGQFHIQKSNDHGQLWSNTWCSDIQINTPPGDEHGRTMVNHGWPWSGNVLTMVEPWLTMVRLYQATMVWPWSTMVSSTFKNQMTMVNHGQIPDVQTFKSTHLWGMNMSDRWPTMVLQYFDHGLTMVNHGQFHIQKSNDHGQSQSNTWCEDIQINTPLGDEHGWMMANHGFAVFWPWSDHGQWWSVPRSKIKWPWSIMVKYLMWRHLNQHTSGGWTWLNHGRPWSGNGNPPPPFLPQVC